MTPHFEQWEKLMESKSTMERVLGEIFRLLDGLPGHLREDGLNLIYEEMTKQRAKLLKMVPDGGEP